MIGWKPKKLILILSGLSLLFKHRFKVKLMKSSFVPLITQDGREKDFGWEPLYASVENLVKQ